MMFDIKKNSSIEIKLIAISISFVLLFLTSILQPSLLPYLQYIEAQQEEEVDQDSCITFDSSDNIIRITCNSASLTDIYNQLKDTNVLNKENSAAANTTTNAATNDKTWLLNAGIEVANGATLYINSTDTKWLKIIGDG